MLIDAQNNVWTSPSHACNKCVILHFSLYLWHACRQKTFNPEKLLTLHFVNFGDAEPVNWSRERRSLGSLSRHFRPRTGSSDPVRIRWTHRFRCGGGSRWLEVWSGSERRREDGRFYASRPQLWRQRTRAPVPKSTSARRREWTGSGGGVCPGSPDPLRRGHCRGTPEQDTRPTNGPWVNRLIQEWTGQVTPPQLPTSEYNLLRRVTFWPTTSFDCKDEFNVTATMA